mmetsp:Transcript_18875/g.24329  ORF Transcript_18875/g.24329 Transcript_18875/m.24329 type:complete len:473 (+) Transcript_18875:194-1612(+)|eukprot:CAMPEP_0117740984 /NCGR_PEP_ID=MMETSP0947-20121206/4650_1 /TAXON_ID=44440 /ORGANISM="Chattonella subsalsa, Strain CCMP2191" /LENGTH=472 /DNA_ID=CAMNT_0005557169 /DNA_START=186 /DNA_END=1604 /DNA_ORIENTATION=-
MSESVAMRKQFPTGSAYVEELKAYVKLKDPDHIEFHQAVDEVLSSLAPVFEEDPGYVEIFKILVEPERIIMFRVPWQDDRGEIQVNRGFRVQFNSALGPYKGGLRFHPGVNLSVTKFLAFEQIFKNSLTTLSMGGAKGGSDFDPKNKSEAEVMRFCQSYMNELFRHIGPTIDVPAGDMGVDIREIGWLFGQYKRLTGSFAAATITQKDVLIQGSHIRPEATGYGEVYFAEEALKCSASATGSPGRQDRKRLRGLRCIISGKGNVSQYTVEKLLHSGAIPIAMSDTTGYIVEPDGITEAQLKAIMELKEREGYLDEYCKFPCASSKAIYVPGKKVWEIPCDLAFPSATENEIDGDDAHTLIKGGCFGVFEGANMPSNEDAIRTFQQHGIIFGPSKAASAGGVSVSGLEMAQNFSFLRWRPSKVDSELRAIMKNIYHQISEAAEYYDVPGDLKSGGNIASFLNIAEAMRAQGAI